MCVLGLKQGSDLWCYTHTDTREVEGEREVVGEKIFLDSLLWASVYLSARLFIHLQSLPFIFLNATTHRLAAADEKEGRALKRHGNFKEMWQIAKQIASSQPLSDVCVDCTVKRCLDTRSVKSLNKRQCWAEIRWAARRSQTMLVIALHVCVNLNSWLICLSEAWNLLPKVSQKKK